MMTPSGQHRHAAAATAVSPVAGQPEVRPSLVPLLSPSSWADRNWRMLECFPVPSTA